MSDSPTMTQADLRDYLIALLRFAGRTSPRKVLVSGLRPLIRFVKRAPDLHQVDSKTGKPTRGLGNVILNLDDEACVDLGLHGGQDAWFLVRLSRSVLDRMESPIKLPSEIVQ